MRNTKKSQETLSAIVFGALTYQAVADKLGIPYSSATARVRRLVKAGKVVFETQAKPGQTQSFAALAQ